MVEPSDRLCERKTTDRERHQHCSQKFPCQNSLRLLIAPDAPMCGGASPDCSEAPPPSGLFIPTSSYGVTPSENMSSFTAPGLRESVQEKRKPPTESAALPA